MEHFNTITKLLGMKDSKNTNEAATSQSPKDFQLTTGLTKQQLANLPLAANDFKTGIVS